jgi:branched-chain amino acid transport system ATP-binding protein
MLEVQGIEASYGRSKVLFGTSLSVREREVVSLMGRNGMGKTTLVRCVLGLLPLLAGTVKVGGVEVNGWPSERIARLGIGIAPEGRQIFPLLTVEENLLATARQGISGGIQWPLARVYELFPILRERAPQRSTTLSGGEQQMLSIGRALMTNPRLLILDEATEGLAPLIRQEIWKCIEALKGAGLSILVIDKNLHEMRTVADRHFIMEKGSIVWSGTSRALAEAPEVVQTYLGL